MIPRLIVAFLLTGVSIGQNLDPRMDQIVQSYVSNKQFMGSVLVACGNDVLLSKGYGSANLEWEIPNTLEFEPGQRFNYSNSGYVLLGYLIEKISGQSYERFVQENIFTPLGMKDSGYDSNSAVIARRAAGYTPGLNGPTNAGFIHMSIPHAAGALYSTTEDLLRWEQGLFGGKVLSAASLQKMTTPFKSASDQIWMAWRSS